MVLGIPLLSLKLIAGKSPSSPFVDGVSSDIANSALLNKHSSVS